MSPHIPKKVQEEIRAQASNRCGYCRSAQKYVLGLLEIEHIVPVAKGGSDDEENLWLACRMCNNFKGTQTSAYDPVSGRKVALFNPRTASWQEHFLWDENGIHIIGLTPCGRATVLALQLNHPIALMVREQWVDAGWHPPSE